MPTTNTLGVHALVWAGDTCNESVDLCISQSLKAGYDLIEFSLHDLAHFDVGRTAAALADAELGVACSRGLSFDADVSSDDLKVVGRGAELLHESLNVTRSLGGTHLTGALYSALGKYPTAMSSAGRANVVASLADLANEASKDGMTLGLEVCNRYETNVVNTAREALRLVDDIGADNIFIHLDTYHMNIEEDDFVRPVREVGARLGYVHIGENHRGYLGSGHIDFTSLFHALADIGYRGPITFESFSSSIVASGLSNALAIWRNTWDDGFELASHARLYIADMLLASAER